MHLVDHLKSSQKPVITIEIIPPKRGANIVDFHRALDSLKPYDIPFINVTSHAADVEWVEQADGSFKRRVKRKSPGTFGLCAVIKYKYNITPVPHILCAGFTREETEDALIELNYLGIDNLLAIRGDGPMRHRDRRDRTVNNYACELVEQIGRLNNGVYQDELIDAARTNFCVGVAAYPERHFEAPNDKFDLEILKRKQEAGACYAVTQMFYDNRHYFSFVERARDHGVTIPIIPGLKVLTSRRQLASLPRHFHIEIPEQLTSRVLGAQSRKEIRSIGIEWAYRQSMELMEKGAPSLHFYIMQRTGPFTRLMDRLQPQLMPRALSATAGEAG